MQQCELLYVSARSSYVRACSITLTALFLCVEWYTVGNKCHQRFDPKQSAYLVEAVRALKVLLFPHLLIAAHALDMVLLII